MRACFLLLAGSLAWIPFLCPLREARAQSQLFVPSETGDEPSAAYRRAYAFVLRERWAEARRAFADLLARHPGTVYADDAEYWSAFALMHEDRTGAREAYERFLEAYPRSRYFDDALADYARLQAETSAQARGDSEDAVLQEAGRAHREAIRAFLRARGRIEAQNRIEPLDPALRHKLENLYMLDPGRDGAGAFTAIRTVALDTAQASLLREAALERLVLLDEDRALPVLIDVAGSDADEFVRAVAVDRITVTKNKDRSVTVLADLFEKLPEARAATRSTVVGAIAGVGNDRAIDFLRRVALRHGDRELRRGAVFYLGTIGGERARAALLEVLTTDHPTSGKGERP